VHKHALLCLPALLVVLGTQPALAADAPADAQPAAGAAAPAAEAPKPPPWYSTITFSGLVDAYYGLRLDAAQDAPVALRAFDGANGFNVGYAKLSVAMAPAPAGFRLDLGFGNAADAIDASSAFSAGKTGSTSAKYVQQAYAAMKLGPAEVNVGRFSTSAGAEVIEAKDDWLYTRSLVFFLEPLTHTGVRVTVPATESISVTAGVNNGWDVVSSGFSGKTGQLSATWTGPSSSTVAVNLYVGENPTLWSGAPNTAGQLRTFLDVVAGATVGPISLLGNFDWATEAADPWWAASLAARYPLPGDVARVSVRGEYARDDKGARFATGTETEVYEGTAGVAIPVGSNSELRVEARYDHANVALFAAGTPSQDQVTGTVAALAWF